ncbi:MAG: DUF2934 domain-containing protein [Candidatus Omnitrophota bacterium]
MAKKVLKAVAGKAGSVKVQQAPSVTSAEQVRSKAYQLWEQKGKVHGKDLEIWLEAERSIAVTQ